MTIEQLRYFLAVTNYMNFTKAASKSYISQPALSRHIAELENSLNTKLFIRDGNNLILTPAGELLKTEGHRILDEFFDLEQNIGDIAAGKVGSLDFCSADMAFDPVFTALRQFSAQYPKIQMYLGCQNPDQVADMVLHYKADLGLTFSFSAGADNPALEQMVISEETFCALVPKHHLLAAQDSVTKKDLQNELMIAIGDSSNKNDVCGEVFDSMQFASINSAAAKKDYHIQMSIESALLQMNAGQGILLLPRPAAREYAHRGKMLEISDLKTRFHVVMIWHREKKNPAVSLFLQCFTPLLAAWKASSEEKTERSPLI